MNLNENIQVTRDEYKKVRILNHNQKPVTLIAETPRQLARSYFEETADIYEIPLNQLSKVTLQLDNKFSDEKTSFRFRTEKKIMDTVVVSYVQTYFGLEVWESAFNIVMQSDPLRVLSSSSSANHDIEVKLPDKSALERTTEFIETEIRKFFLKEKKEIKCSLKLNRKRLIIFRYNASKRVIKHDHKDTRSKNIFKDVHPSHPLPPVPQNIIDGHFYVVHEILFTSELPDLRQLNWIAMVEVETNTVLYLRALVDSSNAFVFVRDPITSTGNSANSPAANTATLNPLRNAVSLQGLVAPTQAGQALTGNFVKISDIFVPNILPPIEIAPYNFEYDARTNNFAAANAYYHCDAFFRIVQDMGFDVPSYFSGTTFPVPVDHRGSIYKLLVGDLINNINAQCAGNATNNGIGKLNFLLAYKEPAYSDTEDVPDPPDLANHPLSQGPLGIAADWRVVLHELAGHGTLWNHVDSPNFGFAHSAGDSVAVILNDPGNLSPDRFASFPWLTEIDRRHDRTVTSGWGWGGAIAQDPFGSNDEGGYNNEQILSTTLFRFYQSIGGDSGNLAEQQFAARFAVYLIIRAEGSLTPGSTPNAINFETALETADIGIWNSTNPAETHACGAYHKVVRWAFEKQGLFQPATAVYPNNNEGVPPDVDVYINDGRNGEYQYLANHWSCQDIWNRTTIGNGSGVHQEPIVGQKNYGYVRIKNRGTLQATNIIVKGFHCKPSVGLTFPTDWTPMTTAQIAAPDLAANDNTGVIVGPFEWTPSQLGHECMFFSVSANDDPSNIDGRITGEIPEWRLVPYDNNIAQRNVAPVPGGGGINGLVEAFENRPFWVNNPFSREAKIALKPVLPKLLQKGGWKLNFITPGKNVFSMQSRESKIVRMQMKPGEIFPKELATISKKDVFITVYAYADGILIGGMTYKIDPKLKKSVFHFSDH
jgi:hypothetical protein